MDRVLFCFAALFGFLGVGLGAFGAHALRGQPNIDARMLEIFETGVRYQMYHALALIGVAWACSRFPGTLAPLSGWLFVAGTVIFSGSLYLLVLTGLRWFGAITPIGGVALLAGWALLLIAAIRSAQ